ncbi:hypothetical protein DH2020_043988 [Rehmannia glutinosa]|uniref:SET domain-containing protein n=1 Tax=Rehmannia glutinosa TaxID=99300 RepID=A0ABR0UI60_REHGL
MSSKMITSLTHSRSLAYAAAASASFYPSRLVPQPPDLIKWVRREGGFVHHSIKIAYLEEEKPNGLGLGLVASDDIPKGSDLISLPQHIPLKFEAKDGESSTLIALARQVPEVNWTFGAFDRGTLGYEIGLKAFARESKKGSFWWPYISNLPETYSVPIFFPGEDIKNLQYAPLLHQVNKRCRFLLEFEKLMKNELDNVKLDDHPFGGQYIDASSLGWAMSAVSSRAFRLYGTKRPDGTHVDAPMLLPLIDMCNHSFTPNAEIVQEKEANNDNMLVKVRIGGSELVEDRLLAALRVLLSNDKEAVEKHDLDTLKSITSVAPLGTSTEVAVFRTVIALCVIALGHFPKNYGRRIPSETERFDNN